MASASVSPAGTVALRAKPDATQFQYSANGAAWADFSGGGSGTVRLDQVLDPAMAAPQIKAFAMGNHQLLFQYAGADAEECMVIETATDAAGGGTVLLLRTNGATTTKSPLRIEGRGTFYMSVGVDGKVAIGAETAINERLNIYQTNTGSDNSGVLFGACTMDTGSTASTVTAATFQLDDSQSTAALTSMHALAVEINRTAGVANTNVTATALDLGVNIGKTTKTVRGLTMNMSCVGTLTVTDWEGIRITAPSTVGSPTITNKRAIITEAGAGNVGFGTLTPAVQLHVAGGVQIDQTVGQTIAAYKYIDSTESVVLHYFRARGTSSSPSNLASSDTVGAIVFNGRVSGAFTQLGYIRNLYSSTLGGVVEIGAAALDQSRVTITETGSVGSVTLFGGTTNYFQVQTSGFQFSHGSTGATYYKDSAGYFVALAIGTVSQVLTVTDIGGGVLQPRWGAAPGGGSAPGGSASELQYRAGASTFGAVTSSSVSGANVTLGGSLTFNNTDRTIVASAVSASGVSLVLTEYSGTQTFPIYLQFDKYRGTLGSPVDIANLDEIGALYFRGRRSGSIAQQAYIRTEWTTTAQGTIEVGAGGTVSTGCLLKLTNNSGLTLQQSSSNYFQITASGFVFSHGTTGAIYYRSAGNLFTALTIGSTSQYLKGGTIPSWGSLDADHITSGTLALANGGTGEALTDPGADRILFWDDSAGVVTWLTASTGLTITGTSMTASGGTPAGSGSELQYRNAGAFGAVTSSSVDGSGVITLGSGSTIWKSDNAILLSFSLYNSSANAPQFSFLKSRGSESSKSAVLAGDALFVSRFYGQYDSVGQRQGGELGFDVQSNFSTTSAGTIFRLKTSQQNTVTPLDRLVIGGTKQLTNATLTDLFTITFGTADQLAMGGEVHLLIVAKGTITGGAHDGVNIFVHRRVISFAIAHNKNNDMMITFTEVQAARAGGASDDTGLTAISHALNSDGAVGTGTNIPSTPNAYATNAITYKILATAVPNLTTLTQLTCYYHIIYHGEAQLTLS